MNDTQKSIFELECRVYALDHMLRRLFALSLSSSPDPVAAAERLREVHLDTLSIETFPIDDPALSDLAAATVQEAFDVFLTGLVEEARLLVEARKS
jgi:hypothetical protein